MGITLNKYLQRNPLNKKAAFLFSERVKALPLQNIYYSDYLIKSNDCISKG